MGLGLLIIDRKALVDQPDSSKLHQADRAQASHKKTKPKRRKPKRSKKDTKQKGNET